MTGLSEELNGPPPGVVSKLIGSPRSFHEVTTSSRQARCWKSRRATVGGRSICYRYAPVISGSILCKSVSMPADARFAGAAHAKFFVNDGKSLPMVRDRSVDFVFSFDSWSISRPTSLTHIWPSWRG